MVGRGRARVIVQQLVQGGALKHEDVRTPRIEPAARVELAKRVLQPSAIEIHDAERDVHARGHGRRRSGQRRHELRFGRADKCVPLRERARHGIERRAIGRDAEALHRLDECGFRIGDLRRHHGRQKQQTEKARPGLERAWSSCPSCRAKGFVPFVLRSRP
jgi:hypothetical protein